MKGPGIKEYVEYLRQLKQSAHNEGKTYIDVSSRNLHEILSPNHATMPTCCQAIYKLMLEGDEILDSPRGHTGYGSRLLVRFYVDELDGKDLKFPLKKRGRPKKSEEQLRRERLLKINRSTDDLKELLTLWLNERGWQVEMDGNNLHAFKDENIWIINVEGSHRGRKKPLPIKLNSILSSSEDERTHYSVAFNDTYNYRKQWNDIPKLMKDKLNVSVLLADKNGKIMEIH